MLVFFLFFFALLLVGGAVAVGSGMFRAKLTTPGDDKRSPPPLHQDPAYRGDTSTPVLPRGAGG